MIEDPWSCNAFTIFSSVVAKDETLVLSLQNLLFPNKLMHPTIDFQVFDLPQISPSHHHHYLSYLSHQSGVDLIDLELTSYLHRPIAYLKLIRFETTTSRL